MYNLFTMAKGYTTEEKIENYILTDIDPSYSGTVTEIIEGVEDIIDNETGRNFKADEEASARLFSGQGDKSLLIDDAVAITLVEVGLDDFGGSFITVGNTGSNRYFTEPSNHAAKLKPITKLLLRDRFFTAGVQNHRITGKWGYSAEVPNDIAFAATVFAAGILNQSRKGGDQIKSERIGNYQVTYNSDNGKDSWSDFERAMGILDKYKRYYL